MANPPLIRTAKVLHFHLCRRFLERLYSSSSSFGLQFLLKELGIPLKLNASLSQKIQFDEKASSNVKSVITFFKSHEFSEAEIAKLIQKDPKILRSRISSNLNPKFQYLLESEFKGFLLRRIVLGNPSIFRNSLSSTIEPVHRFLKTVLGSDESVRVAVKRAPFILTSDLERSIKPNIAYLAKLGVPDSKIRKLIICSPMVIVRSNDNIVYWVGRVKELGIMPHDPSFWIGLRIRMNLSDSTWKRKVEIFKSLGWSDEDVVNTFITQPGCFNISEKKIKAVFNFFVNQAGIAPEVIIGRPLVLMYSLQERIIPRLGVFQVLEAEMLLDCKWTAQTILCKTGETFIRCFIMKYLDRIPNLMDIYLRSKKSDIVIFAGVKQTLTKCLHLCGKVADSCYFFWFKG